jgi:hypothetical protein
MASNYQINVGPEMLRALCAACCCQPEDLARYIMHLQSVNPKRRLIEEMEAVEVDSPTLRETPLELAVPST